jgi:hypothetical protein
MFILLRRGYFLFLSFRLKVYKGTSRTGIRWLSMKKRLEKSSVVN